MRVTVKNETILGFRSVTRKMKEVSVNERIIRVCKVLNLKYIINYGIFTYRATCDQYIKVNG